MKRSLILRVYSPINTPGTQSFREFSRPCLSQASACSIYTHTRAMNEGLHGSLIHEYEYAQRGFRKLGRLAFANLRQRREAKYRWNAFPVPGERDSAPKAGISFARA